MVLRVPSTGCGITALLDSQTDGVQAFSASVAFSHDYLNPKSIGLEGTDIMELLESGTYNSVAQLGEYATSGAPCGIVGVVPIFPPLSMQRGVYSIFWMDFEATIPPEDKVGLLFFQDECQAQEDRLPTDTVVIVADQSITPGLVEFPVQLIVVPELVIEAGAIVSWPVQGVVYQLEARTSYTDAWQPLPNSVREHDGRWETFIPETNGWIEFRLSRVE